jgi:RimJ/RimL family protein N-acetyltransferase
MDLFRPLLTMRLPTSGESGQVDPRRTTELIYSAVSPGTALILSAPQPYRPYISALFEIQSEVQLTLMELDRDRYEPIINVLVTESESYNSLPRFVVRSTAGSGENTSQVAASAGINWQSPYFADIYVHTKPAFRRRGFGRSVVAAVVQRVLSHGRTPLYSVAVDNQASIQLAESVGFADTGLIDILYEATLKPNPT